MAANLGDIGRGHRAGRDPDLPVPDAGAGHARRADAGGRGDARPGVLLGAARGIAHAELAAEHASALCCFRADCRLSSRRSGTRWRTWGAAFR